MKKIITLALSFIAYFSFGQVTSYTVYTDSTYGCSSFVYVSIVSGPDADNGTFTFDWGDGTIDTENFTTTPNTNISLSFSHSYLTSGNYITVANLYSNVLAGNVGLPQTNDIDAQGATTCGSAYFYVNHSPSGINFYNVPLDFTDNADQVTTIVPSSNYSFYSGLNPANAPYTVRINTTWLADNSLLQVSPNKTISSFDSNGSAITTDYEFEVTCNGTTSEPDLYANYGYASNFVAPLETGLLHVNICNLSCSNSADASVTLTMPAGFVPTTTTLTNPMVNGNELSFDLTAVSACETIIIPFSFPGTTPAGTEICFDVVVTNPNDINLSNNSTTICGIVLNSYDPNDKHVSSKTHLNPDVKETLVYRVQFQNDGNYNAINVKIKDIIDANLDLSTLKVLESKHGVGTTIDQTSREVVFTFNNAYLAPSGDDLEGSRGYVVYSIQENENLPLNSEIENTASIFFDFNPAIVTNTTYNINSTELGIDKLNVQEVAMYPNPATGLVKFSGAEISKIQVYNLAGQLVHADLNMLTNELNVATLANGFYQVVVTTEKGDMSLKLSVQR